MSAEHWYYLDEETAVGPFTWQRILELRSANLLTGATYVWQEGAADWVLLRDVMRVREPVLAVAEAALSTAPPKGRASETRDEPAPAASDAREAPTAAAQPDPEPDLPPDDLPELISDDNVWLPEPVSGWRRFGARMLDFTATETLVGALWYVVDPQSAVSTYHMITLPKNILIEFIVVTLVNCAVAGTMVGLTGSSIGKHVFGIRVVGPDLKPLGVSKGIGRELRVWIYGLGLGIPILMPFTLITARIKLKKDRVSAWDRGRSIVLYKPNSYNQRLLSATGASLTVAVQLLLRLS